jgi:hypothetical protein
MIAHSPEVDVDHRDYRVILGEGKGLLAIWPHRRSEQSRRTVRAWVS